MAEESKHLHKKILDDDLRHFVASNGPDTVTVLIEVEVSDLVVEFPLLSSKLPNSKKPIAVRHNKKQMEAESQAVEQVKMLLDSIGVKGRFLSSACVFIVDATPAQLQRIVESPSVRGVIPNREIRMKHP